MGAKNGGFLRDVSEAGVCFQWFPGIMPLRGGQTVQVKFKLPGTDISIEAEGQFVRHGNSEKGGGLRLLNLPAEVQLQIREWVARREHADAAISSEPGVLPEPSGPATLRGSFSGATGFLPLFWIKRWLKARLPSPPRWGAPAPIISERIESGGVAVELAAGKPELPTATALASLGPTKSQTKQRTHASGRAAVSISKQERPAITGAANELKVRETVLQSMAATQQSAAKGSRKAQLGVVLAVGSLALAAIGGGLVATGRLRLNTSFRGNPPRSTVEVPVRQQPEAPGISLSSAPAPSRQAAATGQRSLAQNVKPSRSHPVDPSGAVQRAVNRPVAETNATPRQATVQAPTLSIGTAAPQPEAETRAPAPVTQSAAPVTQSTAASAPVFRSPNPEAAQPTNFTPAKLLLRIDPVYPQENMNLNPRGDSVEVLATIGKDGVLRGLKATRGDPRLAAAALAAISRWRYSPAMLNGQPEESQITITVDFITP
jgi:TonB family protein